MAALIFWVVFTQSVAGVGSQQYKQTVDVPSLSVSSALLPSQISSASSSKAALSSTITTATALPHKAMNCSHMDYSNGVLCECAYTLNTKCAVHRGGNDSSCLHCVQDVNVTNSGLPCSKQIQAAFCQTCAPAFEFEWVANVSKSNSTAGELLVVVDEEQHKCQSHQPNVHNSSGDFFGLSLLRILGCSKDTIWAYFTALGYNVVATRKNSTLVPFDPLHGNTIAGLTQCCLNYKVTTAHDSCGVTPKAMEFWKYINKETGCEASAMETALGSMGIAFPTLAKYEFGGLFTIDVRKNANAVKGLAVTAFDNLYSDTVSYLLGLELAAAKRNGCGNSWFMPGVDRIYANTYHVQGDFHFPAKFPNPTSDQATCGTSIDRSEARLDVCTQVAAMLYGAYNMSGMAIMGCAVDCFPSPVEMIAGSFVSIAFTVVEVSTNSSGLGAYDGLTNVVKQFDSKGFNVTNELSQIVGTGFRFSYTTIAAQDLLDVMTAGGIDVEGLPIIDNTALLPNMTAAFLAYERRMPAPSPTPPQPKPQTTQTLLVVAVVVLTVVPTTLLIAVVARSAATNEVFDDGERPRTPPSPGGTRPAPRRWIDIDGGSINSELLRHMDGNHRSNVYEDNPSTWHHRDHHRHHHSNDSDSDDQGLVLTLGRGRGLDNTTDPASDIDSTCSGVSYDNTSRTYSVSDACTSQ
eukprot:m.60411 g.60411  ORF g.60411 m.60411 type:complete len:689 (+) comp22833_c0_seq4:413-2479(+)